ncbi:MAG: HD domain-containing phosphohydrolase [Candidatus Hydrogenedentota bacterium]
MQADGNRILVVDDETVIRELMTDILTEEGYEVDSASDAYEALELLRKNAGFVVLFTDIMMPKMDGISLIREAKQIRPSLIPIVMTGYATLDSARAAVKEGAYDYVLKPFSLSEIKFAVSNALDRYTLARENARLREVTELFRISESIATIHDERRLLDFVLHAALDRVGAERGSVMLAIEGGKALQVAATIGLPDEALNTYVDVGKSISGWVAEHSIPLCVRDIEENPDLVELSRKLEDASFISVPLERKLQQNGKFQRGKKKDDPRVIAVLNVNQKANGGSFTEGDLKILNIIANHASVALENVRLLKAVEDAHLATLQSSASLLEAKDPYTHGHSERVRNYSVLAAKKLGMAEDDVDTLRLAAMLHDVGKIGVSDTILNKVEPLTDDEWEQIKRHPVIGYDVLEPVGLFTKEHLAVVRSHHERLDGSGYPDGLKGDQIDERVRVIAVADTYDAMSGDRAYRKGMSPEKITAELQRCAGTHLDNRVARLFIDMIKSGELVRFSHTGPSAGHHAA